MITTIKDFSTDFSVFFIQYVIYFSIIMLLLIIIKSDLIKDIFIRIKINKFFIIFVLLIAVVFQMFLPHIHLTYFDEQSHIVQAKNIREGEGNTLCREKIDGKCIDSSMPSTALGPSSIYSLLYNKDTHFFEETVRIFNIVMYFLTFFIVYIVTFKVSENEYASRISSSLVLLMPLNIVYSTTLMPEMLAVFFLSLSLYFLYDIAINRKLLSVFGFLISVMILLTIRIEYVLLLIVGISVILYTLYYLNKEKRLFLKENIYTLIFIAPISLLSINVISFFFNKVIGTNKQEQITIGVEYFNLVFIRYYFLDILSIFLMFGFIIYIAYLLKKISVNGNHRIIHMINISLILIFIINIILFSFMKSGTYDGVNLAYRHMLPITTIFLIFSACGIGIIFERSRKYKILNKKTEIAAFLVIIILVVSFSAGEIYRIHDEYNKSNRCEKMYVNLLAEIKSEKMLEEGTVFIGPYFVIGDYFEFENFVTDVSSLNRSININDDSGKRTYLVLGPNDISLSKKLNTRELYVNNECEYGIFMII